ncbi:10741_t:CDS:1, partial [Gigaspora margarita]
HLVDHVNEELNANNLQHVEAIIYNLDHALQLSQDIEKAKNQRVQHMT